LSGGARFLAKKVDDLFLFVALKDCLNMPPNLTRQAKTVLKIDSCSGWGVHFVSCGGALTHFPCKLRLKNYFSPPWGVQLHPLHPLATPMFGTGVIAGKVMAGYGRGAMRFSVHNTGPKNHTDCRLKAMETGMNTAPDCRRAVFAARLTGVALPFAF